MVDVVKRAAELLKEGAVMLPETCPLCGSPLYKLKDGRIVCPIHGEIRKITSRREETEIKVDNTLDDLINAILEKVIDFTSKIPKATKLEADELNIWLSNLEKAIEIRRKLSISKNES
ncbi:hypothetical protein EYM_06090 [Ignicoccus islandicus DSM 13165]|uniref:Sjogrens syndrome scleroderma autoantigen 1 n=1 Tax=Ignicoccus islandicus DSM 13165 TaxID=940295 RepID=A0A0U3FJ50_9CREN|nr:Sjogren's syndrome/scleroderma autoantigen 1 family protein [Ignicoccus islandicus]ALU11910.1 hypothetical protein EYM_06090 [Ignicoccus islandicus DSM 13165]